MAIRFSGRTHLEGGGSEMLNQRMSQNEMKIWITETGIRNRSILDSYGMGLNAPLAICVESEKTAKEIFDIFSGFGSS